MKASKNIKQLLNLDQAIYVGLLIFVATLLAIISIRYPAQSDWSYNNRNTLHTASQEILAQMPEDIYVNAFIGDEINTRNAIRLLISRYQYYKKNIQLSFIDPKKNPAQTRALGIQNQNEVIISYQDKHERLQTLSEELFSNALQRLARDAQQYIVFLRGHGERHIDHPANHNFSLFAQRLRDKGFNLQSLNLTEISTIPESTQLLVIADPQTPLLAGETNVIRHYLNQGGNLLWLSEPDSKNTLSNILPALNIECLPGSIADNSAQLNVGQLDYTLASQYPPHPITTHLDSITLFPQACGLNISPKGSKEFTYTGFLRSNKHSWIETDPQFSKPHGGLHSSAKQKSFNQDPHETPGPIVFGAAITRTLNNIQQRLVVIGDADFLANAYLGNGGNLELGLNIFNWLSFDEHFISIKPLTPPDSQLQLGNFSVIFIAATFLLIIPFGLFASGLVIWWKRRRK